VSICGIWNFLTGAKWTYQSNCPSIWRSGRGSVGAAAGPQLEITSRGRNHHRQRRADRTRAAGGVRPGLAVGCRAGDLAGEDGDARIADFSGRRLFFFHRDGDSTVRRKANFLAFNISDQAQVDEMMVSLVPAFTAVGFSQFDPTIFNSIDGSDVHTVCPDYLHMLFYPSLSHFRLSYKGKDNAQVSRSFNLPQWLV
jgi:hypothetical protein